jgi:hypothetical protein
LDALGPEYQALVDSVLLNAVPTTLNRIQGLALEYELRIIRGKLHRAAKNGNEDDDQNNYALSVAGSTPSKAKHRKETNHRSSSESDATGSLCGHCGKTNHLTENCITHLKEQINELSNQLKAKPISKGEAMSAWGYPADKPQRAM